MLAHIQHIITGLNTTFRNHCAIMKNVRQHIRGDRSQGNGAAGIQDVAARRHRDRDRDDSARTNGRSARPGTAAGKEAARLVHGLESLPSRHAPLRRLLSAGQAPPRRHDLAAHQAGRCQRRARGARDRRSRAQRDHVRLNRHALDVIREGRARLLRRGSR